MGCNAVNNVYDIHNETNLAALAATGKTEILISKIQYGGSAVDINAVVNFKGDTLLHYACARGD